MECPGNSFLSWEDTVYFVNSTKFRDESAIHFGPFCRTTRIGGGFERGASKSTYVFSPPKRLVDYSSNSAGHTSSELQQGNGSERRKVVLFFDITVVAACRTQAIVQHWTTHGVYLLSSSATYSFLPQTSPRPTRIKLTISEI